MERLNADELPVLKDALTGIYAEDGQMLQFTEDNIRLLQFVDTGETRHEVMRTADQEFVVNVPVKKAQAISTFMNLGEYVLANPPRQHAASTEDPDDASYEEWKSSFPDEETFKEAARGLVESKKPDETLPCSNCKGNPSFQVPCACTQASVHYYDMVDDTQLSDKADDLPDPACGTCNGSGHKETTCGKCLGAGYMMKYPQVAFVNDMTGQTASIEYDIAAMIHEEKIQVERSVYNFNLGGMQGANVKWVFPLAEAEALVLASIDLDPANIAIAGVERIQVYRSHILASPPFSWNAGNSQLSARLGRGGTNEAKPDAWSMIVDAQAEIARQYAWIGLLANDAKDDKDVIKEQCHLMGKVVNDDLVVQEVILRLRPLRPLEDAFNDLVTAVTGRGFTLGFSLSFIATGEVGPSFYLLDQQGRVAAQLSNDYDIRTSLENAWLSFQETLSRM